ncbi:MAG: hypothetical protein WCG08_10785 [Paludibacter sp.]
MNKNYVETNFGQKRMKLSFLLLTVFFTLAMAVNAIPTGTYTWNVASGAWTDAASWTPARTTPADNDILIFDGSTFAAPTVTGLIKQTVGQLNVINGATVTISSSVVTVGTGTIVRAATAVTGTGTAFTTQLVKGDFIYTGTTTPANQSEVLTVTDDTHFTTGETGTIASMAFNIVPTLHIGGNPGLSIASGSSLILSPTTISGIYVNTAATASIAGNLTLSGITHKIDAADAGAIVFTSTGTFTQGLLCTGNAFTAVGTANAVVFNSGAKFNQLAGSNPIALTSPATKVTFNAGSTFSIQQNAAPSFSGRTYANFEINSSAFSQTMTGSSAFTCENLTLTSLTLFQFNFNGALSVKGNLTVGSGATTVNITPLAANTLTFSGTGTQTISNSSAALTFGSNLTIAATSSTLVFNNAAGATLTYKASLPGTLNNSGTFAISGTVTALTGTINTTLLSATTGGKVTTPTGSVDISALNLNIGIILGYWPKTGDKITLISGPSAITGTPATVTYPSIGTWHLDNTAGVLSAMCDFGTSINQAYNNLEVSTSNGTVSFSSEAGKNIEIYNSVGQRLISTKTLEGVNTIPVSTRGVVLVKVDNRIAKVIL